MQPNDPITLRRWRKVFEYWTKIWKHSTWSEPALWVDFLKQTTTQRQKCAHLAITNKQYQFYLGKEIIASADYQNDWGLTLSRHLKWNLHIDKVCAKAMKVFHMIKRNVSDLSSAAKLNLYKSMIVPILIYGSPCYGKNKHVLTELEHVQKRVVNWVLFGSESYKDKLRSLCILPLPMYIQINNILLLSKLICGRYDTSQISLPSYSTLSRFVLFQPEGPKKKTLEDIFFYQSCRLADILKIDLLNQPTLKKYFWK